MDRHTLGPTPDDAATTARSPMTRPHLVRGPCSAGQRSSQRGAIYKPLPGGAATVRARTHLDLGLRALPASAPCYARCTRPLDIVL
ncbi:hypothetical protein MRX96_044343 [Rhipicephalus microplus]